jgi:hypothetical protein
LTAPTRSVGASSWQGDVEQADLRTVLERRLDRPRGIGRLRDDPQVALLETATDALPGRTVAPCQQHLDHPLVMPS